MRSRRSSGSNSFLSSSSASTVVPPPGEPTGLGGLVDVVAARLLTSVLCGAGSGSGSGTGSGTGSADGPSYSRWITGGAGDSTELAAEAAASSCMLTVGAAVPPRPPGLPGLAAPAGGTATGRTPIVDIPLAVAAPTGVGWGVPPVPDQEVPTAT